MFLKNLKLKLFFILPTEPTLHKMVDIDFPENTFPWRKVWVSKQGL